ncbi:MAG: hypothetical protein IT443_10725 [Phycisphaeraceae bacterium]|nr:hypothetical protein [Phycisphaeraceae bacterium]
MAIPTEKHVELGIKGTAVRGWWLALGVGAMLGLYGVDFFFDVRHRDALSWMDPYQYFLFAVDWVGGGRAWSGFEVASLFPALIAPWVKLGMWWRGGVAAAEELIPLALGVNMLGVLVLAGAVIWLGKTVLGEQKKSAWLGLLAAVLSSPLLLGLSRELYIELWLAALVAWQYALWFGARHCSRPWVVAGWGVVLAAGLLLKTTYGLFVLGPWAVEVIFLWRGRRWRDLGRLGAACILAVVLAGGVAIVVMRGAAGYYFSLGNTRLPVMALIGPIEVFSWSSVSYYPWQMVRCGLFLLAPFLFLPLLDVFWGGKNKREEAGWTKATLWAGILLPMAVLTAIPVKEPRHIAPLVVPGVLLLFLGLERVGVATLKRVLLLLVGAAALGQYLLVTGHLVACPYFLDGKLDLRLLAETMLGADRDVARFEQQLAGGQGAADVLAEWKYSRNYVLAGFEPNESLALTWFLNPGVVYDLDAVDSSEINSLDWLPPGGSVARTAYEHFEDLQLICAFNAYNRRCLWLRHDATLTWLEQLKQADFGILKGYAPQEAMALLPHHVVVGTIDQGGVAVVITARRAGLGTPYRLIYARQYVQRGAWGDDAELDPIFLDMLATLSIGVRSFAVADLLGVFPLGYLPGNMPGRGRVVESGNSPAEVPAPRNIYWLAGSWDVRGKVWPTYVQVVRQLRTELGDKTNAR